MATTWQFAEYAVPAAKRARLENNNHVPSRTNTTFFDPTMNHATTVQQQNWLRLREMRRASIAQFMDHSSPIKLDTSIDKGIFDCNPLLTDSSNGVPRMQLPPPPFNKPFDEEKPKQQQIDDDPVGDAVKVSKELNDELEEPPKKAGTKRKTNSNEVRFRSHQAESWMEKYEELLDYRLKNGDCLVPNQYPPNPSLAGALNFSFNFFLAFTLLLTKFFYLTNHWNATHRLQNG